MTADTVVPPTESVEPTTDIEKTTADQVSKINKKLTVLGIHIPPVRCSVYLKNCIQNTSLNTELDEIKQKLTTASETEKKDLMSKKKELSTRLIRISSETAITIAIICNYFVEELVKHSINENNKNNGKKMINIDNLMSGNHTDNLFYFLYSKLPTFVNYQPPVVNTDNKTKKNKKSKNAEDTDKSTEDTNKTTEVQPDTDTKANDNMKAKSTFITYIRNIFIERLASLSLDNKISQDVKAFLSNLVVECIKRFVALTKILIQQFIKIKTINSDHIKAIICMLMKDANKTDDAISQVITMINDKLTLYIDYNKNERTKKVKSTENGVNHTEPRLNGKTKPVKVAKPKIIKAKPVVENGVHDPSDTQTKTKTKVVKEKVPSKKKKSETSEIKD